MASRRMISKRVVDSARFQKMPISSQALYFYLCLDADDDGVVEAYQVLRKTGCGEDDLRVLVAKGFVTVLNEDLVTFILDWREHNQLRADRKIDSIYKDLLISVIPDVKLLEAKPRADRKAKENSEETSGTSQGRPMDGLVEVSIVKDSKVENNIINNIDVVDSYDFSTELRSKVLEWLEFKKERRQTYKPRGLKTLLNNIKKYSDIYGDSPVIEQIEKSMVNNYQGIFLDNIPKYCHPLQDGDSSSLPNKTAKGGGWE